MHKILAMLLATTLLISGCTVTSKLKSDPTASAGVVRISATERKAPIIISGKSFDGSLISTESFTDIVVVNAWASWCRTCIFEWRDLQTVASRNSDVSFLGLNESDTKQAAVKFLSTHQTTYGHIFDPDNAILKRIKDLPSLAIPTTLVLDSQHRIAARIMGQVHGDDLERIINDLRSE